MIFEFHRRTAHLLICSPRSGPNRLLLRTLLSTRMLHPPAQTQEPNLSQEEDEGQARQGPRITWNPQPSRPPSRPTGLVRIRGQRHEANASRYGILFILTLGHICECLCDRVGWRYRDRRDGRRRKGRCRKRVGGDDSKGDITNQKAPGMWRGQQGFWDRQRQPATS